MLDYEKQGVKLYGLSPLPFLLYFLRMAAKNSADKEAAGIMVGEILAADTAAVGIAGTAAGTGTAVAAAGGGAAATTSTAATGIFAGVSAKVIAGILAGVVAVGSVTAGAIAISHSDAAPAATVPTDVIAVMETGAYETIPATEAPATEAATVPTETESTEAEATTAPTETEPAATESITKPSGTEHTDAQPEATEAIADETEPPETEAPAEESTTAPEQPTEDDGTSEESGSGDCPACGIGNIGAVTISEATCDYRGEVAWQCDHCGEIAGYSYPPAADHVLEDDYDLGYTICTICGEVYGPLDIGGGGAPEVTESIEQETADASEESAD